MIKGIGVDICDLRRLNHLDQLAKKILHVDEFSLYLSKGNDKAKREFVGGRFAYIKDEPCHVSISHENHYAVAFVVIENNDPNQ